MAVPESDLKLIASWCEGPTPERVRDQVWIEYDATAPNVDIMERRPDWVDPQNRPTMRFPIGRMRYTAYAGLWTTYWRNRNEKFHLYESFQPTPDVREALAFLQTAISSGANTRHEHRALSERNAAQHGRAVPWTERKKHGFRASEAAVPPRRRTYGMKPQEHLTY